MSDGRAQPCVFFDRDGIANVPPDPEQYYVLSPDQLLVFPEFLESLAIVAHRGFASVIVTNQMCVHKGLIPIDVIDRIHDKLRAAITAANTPILDIYVCPHGDDHPDRKPNPGMLLRAARDYNLDLSRSWMIGDNLRDMAAGRAAGCAVTVLVNAETHSELADYRLPEISALPRFLERHLPSLARSV